MKNKWKEFAINQVMSCYGGDAADLYDALMDSPEGDLADVFNKYNALEWEPFEGWGPSRIAGVIYNMARVAQETEELE
jgi:hypothetical protein